MITPFGIVYTWNYQYGEQPAAFVNDEIRVYQQFGARNNLGRFILNHRFRTEERFIQTHSAGASGEPVDEGFDENFQFRIRYRLIVNYPLSSKELVPKAWFASAGDEIFLSWGDAVTYHKPDQNRVFGGIGYQFTKSASIVGYGFYQMLIKSNGTKQENNVGAFVMLTWNLDLREAD